MKAIIKLDNNNRVKYCLELDVLTFILKVTLQCKINDISYIDFIQNDMKINKIEDIDVVIKNMLPKLYEEFRKKYELLTKVDGLLNEIKSIEIETDDDHNNIMLR